MHQRFRNLYRMSNIYIGHPIYISDVRYLYLMSDIPALALALAEVGYCRVSDVGYRYRTSNIYIGRPVYISEVRYRYQMSDIGTRMSDIGTRMSDLGTWMSDIDIRRRIYTLDVRYIYWTSDIYIGRLI